jgi:hypothetical protein
MLLAGAIAILLVGPGELALERLMLRRRSARSRQTASQLR